MEFEAQDEGELERLIKFMSLKLCLSMYTNKQLSNEFLYSKTEIMDELSFFQPIDDISKSMKYYHSLHENECCACS